MIGEEGMRGKPAGSAGEVMRSMDFHFNTRFVFSLLHLAFAFYLVCYIMIDCVSLPFNIIRGGWE